MRQRKRTWATAVVALGLIGVGLAAPSRFARAEAESSPAAKQEAVLKQGSEPVPEAKPAKKGGDSPVTAEKNMPADVADDAVTETTIKKERYQSVSTGKKGPRPPCPVQSKEEVQVLLHLRERHTVLLARESELAQREAHLKDFEKTLRERMAHVTVALGSIEQQLNLGAAGEKAREQRLTDLVDTVSKLSAKKAAPMLAQAEPEIVADLFRRLGPQRASALLAVMPPAKAGKLIDYAANGSDPASKSASAPARGN